MGSLIQCASPTPCQNNGKTGSGKPASFLSGKEAVRQESAAPLPKSRIATRSPWTTEDIQPSVEGGDRFDLSRSQLPRRVATETCFSRCSGSRFTENTRWPGICEPRTRAGVRFCARRLFAGCAEPWETAHQGGSPQNARGPRTPPGGAGEPWAPEETEAVKARWVGRGDCRDPPGNDSIRL
jgi:hypothetical protein